MSAAHLAGADVCGFERSNPASNKSVVLHHVNVKQREHKRDMISIAKDVACSLEMKAFEALDVHNIVFEAPFVSFEWESFIHLCKPSRDGMPRALVGIFRYGPENFNWVEPIALNCEADPHIGLAVG